MRSRAAGFTVFLLGAVLGLVLWMVTSVFGGATVQAQRIVDDEPGASAQALGATSKVWVPGAIGKANWGPVTWRRRTRSDWPRRDFRV